MPKTIKKYLNGVQVAPFGPKLGQNDGPDLRIIFQTLLGPKSKFKSQKTILPKSALFPLTLPISRSGG